MSRESAFFSDKTDTASTRYKNESRFYVLFGIVLAVCGMLLLTLPVIHLSILFFVASWLLFVAVILAIIRPAMYARGLPDAVMGLLSAAFYGFIGYIADGENLMDIEGYKLALCVFLLFVGLARLIVFARMITVVNMPMQLICFAANILSAALLLWGVPSSKASTVYWYAGMLLLVDAVESFTEAIALSRHVEGKINYDD
jgi:uncharacterized membrane protein HdeD (DUF308 family)